MVIRWQLLAATPKAGCSISGCMTWCAGPTPDLRSTLRTTGFQSGLLMIATLLSTRLPVEPAPCIEGTLADSKTGSDIWVLPLFGDKKAYPYLQTNSNETSAKLSLNGQWLAYQSDETKRNEIYVTTFPQPGGKWQVSTNGGSAPVW